MKTRSGRIVKSPRNEYTDREYVAGSGFVGADHYDRNYDGGVTIDEMKYKGSGEYDAKDGFVVDEVEEAECEEESEEEQLLLYYNKYHYYTLLPLSSATNKSKR